MKRWIALTLAAVTALATLSGCSESTKDSTQTTDTSSQQRFPNWPALLNDFRFHWSAEPGIDVTTQPAMILRANVEAYGVAAFTLNLDNLYPGFRRSTPENQQPQGDFLWQLAHVRPLGAGFTKTAKDARPHFGYQSLHFLELTPVGDGYRAIVCSGEYANFVQSAVRTDKFVSIGTNDVTALPIRQGDSGVRPFRIEFTQRDPHVGVNPPAQVTVPQRGPAPAPGQDVFGDWFVTGASSSGWGPSGDPKSRDFPAADLQRRCEDAMPQNTVERVAMMTGFKDQPPPSGEAVPGWPQKSN